MLRTPTVTINTKQRSPMEWARKERVKRPENDVLAEACEFREECEPRVMPAQNPEVTYPTLLGSPWRNWTKNEITHPEIATSAPW